jgi:hypothetical protein
MKVNPLYVLAKLIWSDFIERTRRYSFLLTLGAMLYIGYAAVPAPQSGVLTVNLAATGSLRGVYNSAWIGSIVALLSAMVLSLPGFYLVKNAIRRDRQTRVGQIVATTPLRKATYTLGKAASNWVFLGSIMAVVAVAAGGMQFLRGESTRLDVWALFSPFMLATLPTMALVAAVAVLFESIPFLQGGLGNILYFVLYIAALIASMSSVTFSGQGVIEAPANDLFGATAIGASMLQGAHAAYPDRPLELGIGYAEAAPPVDTYRWTGVQWTAGQIGGRVMWLGVALGIALLSALFFNRFDPARERRSVRRRGLATRLGDRLRSLSLPRLNLGRASTLPTLPLPPFFRTWVAELRLTLKGLRWWWYLGALGLVIAGLAVPIEHALRPVLALAWVWPVLVWSRLGVREGEHHTGAVVFSAPQPLRRQFPALWLSGVLVSVLAGSGVGLRLLLAGEWAHLLGWAVAGLFIPTMALALGVWSGTSRAFEGLYVAWWYIGPLQGTPGLDFMALSQRALDAGLPLRYLSATVVLIAVALLGRWRQVRR